MSSIDNQQLTKRVPPQNLEAEQAVLGGLLMESDAWDDIADLVKEADFYSPAHKMIFASIGELIKNNRQADLITLTDWLMQKQKLEAVGGVAYLNEILENTVGTASLIGYANIVREKSLLRQVIHMTQSTMEEAFSTIEDIDAFLDRIEAKFFQVAEQKNTSGLIDASELVKSSMMKIEELYGQKGQITGVPSGFQELDDMTAGFQPGEMIILAARPSMGKTAFGLNCALNAALRENKKVAFFSVEMGKESIMTRLLASAAKVSLSDIRVGHLDDKAWPRLINTAAALSETGLFIDDTAGISPFEIRAKCRRMKKKHGIDMIMIDYLQLMSMKEKYDSREREVSEISKLLKSIAKELQVPVIALAQLNRGVEGRTDKRPMLSDLRESGSIEQDADVIMMIFREDYYDRDNPDIKGVAEIIIGKQRNGPTGAVKLKWIPQFGLFDNHVAGPPDSPMPDAPPPGSGFKPKPKPSASITSADAPPRGPNGEPPNFAPGGP
jgi:replicative DNA helicase